MMGSELTRTKKFGVRNHKLRTFPHISQIDWLGAHHLAFLFRFSSDDASRRQ
jgi:hypothetical protein